MKLPEINGAKFLLIAGVVLIHCNLTEDPDLGGGLPAVAAGVINYLSGWLCSVCVPLFFLFSGFLFFRPADRLTPRLYAAKLRSRLHTLLVPYLLWNTIAGMLFVYKTYFRGYEAFGTIDNPWLLVDGFWSLQSGYPFDFPLWFLRNLIVMCVLSPFAWLLGRNNYGMAVAVLFFILSGHDLRGGLYFVAGVWLRVHPRVYAALNRRFCSIAGAVVWAGLGLLFLYCFRSISEPLYNLLWCVYIGASLCAVLGGGRLLRGHAEGLAQLTFFIYAWHGLYCSIVRGAMMRFTGIATTGQTLLAYVLTCAVLIISSLIVYVVAHRLLPRFTSILTGGR